MEPVWKKWWRHFDGEIYEDNGFNVAEYDPETWYFNTDPNISNLDYVSLENTYCESELFTSESDAKAEAIKLCLKNISDYQAKLRKLT